MTELELVDWINNRLSRRCALPFKLTQQHYEDIIEDSKEFFYRNWYKAVEQAYMVIPEQAWMTDDWIHKKIIRLPDCVFSIYRCEELKGGVFYAIGQNDLYRYQGSGRWGDGLFGDGMLYMTAQLSYASLMESFVLRTIRFDYNQNSNVLKILGREPKYPVWLAVYVKLPSESLYEDLYFRQYCLYRAMEELGAILQAFGYNLPGGVTLDVSVFKDEGQTKREALEQKMDDETVPDWFVSFGA